MDSGFAELLKKFNKCANAVEEDFQERNRRRQQQPKFTVSEVKPVAQKASDADVRRRMLKFGDKTVGDLLAGSSPKKNVVSSGSPHKRSSGAAPLRATQRYGEELVGGQAAPSDASKPRRSSLPSLALVLECVEAQQRPHMSALCTIERDVAARAAAAPGLRRPEPSCPVPRFEPPRQRPRLYENDENVTKNAKHRQNGPESVCMPIVARMPQTKCGLDALPVGAPRGMPPRGAASSSGPTIDELD